MGKNSAISWCDATWQVVAGCSVESPGCAHCYSARLLATRLKHLPWAKGLAMMGPDKTPHWTGKVLCRNDQLAAPLGWRDPLSIFVGDRGDLFHEKVPDEYIAAVFGVMAACPQHTFLVLTKRAERMREWSRWVELQGHCAEGVCRSVSPLGNTFPHAGWPLPNVWLGVTAEDQQRADERIPHLLATPAAHRWVSCEPLLGPIDFSHIGDALFDRKAAIRAAMNGPAAMNFEQADAAIADVGLDWVVVGGENAGSSSRPYGLGWGRSIIRQCRAAGVPVFHKQVGCCPVIGEASDMVGRRIYQWHAPAPDSLEQRIALHLRHRSGADPSEWPEDLRVRDLGWSC